MKKDSDQIRPEIEALRERVSRLYAAVLRASSSLDLATVLQEAVDSARSLTSACHGVITTVDRAGHPQEFVSSGIPADEERNLAEWPDGRRLFEYLRDLPGPVRIADLPGYVRSLGFSTELLPYRTLQATPMRHRGAHVGTFFLAEKEGGREFTSEDEEVLVLFAAQAATAIANARIYRDEQRARADLKALVDTSPVGVVVFDAKTGDPVSFNREAKRLVGCLQMPGGSVEQLLEIMTCRRADGREVALAEFPLAAQWRNDAETVRAEEIVLSVPDGRSVKTLLNATPIRLSNGKVESMVVTMQDLAPLEELERMRAQFLNMVSHELRTPLISIKGSTATVLGAAPAPDPAEMLQFFRVIDDQADHMRGLIGDLLDQGRIEAGTLSVSPEPAELAGLVDQAKNTFLSTGSRHAVRIDLPEDLPPVMADRRRIVQVLNNLLSNAARHSFDAFPIRVAAVREGLHVAVTVADEGEGVPADRLPFLFQKYTGLAAGGRGRAASGLGLVICKGLVEAHGGRIWAESGGVGRGTQFTFTVPVADGTGESVPRSRSTTNQRAGERATVLVLDDDPQMLHYIRDVLAAAGYTPLVTGDPRELPDLIRTHQPQLVLLDLLLPGIDGIQLMERVAEMEDLPVIFISAYGREETIAKALDSGAADYIVKPFSPTELTARVRAALRRGSSPEPFQLGELSIGYDERQVTVAGRVVELTATEFEVLRMLSEKAGRVVAYGSLLRRAWSGRDRGYGDPALVRAVVRRLRRKLGDNAAEPAYIFNVRGVGYRMPGPGDP